jgi:hypothetical protein
LNSMMRIWPNSRAPYKLTWQVEDDEGNLCTVSRIHAVFCPNSGKLSGFVLDYGTVQISRTAGSADGVKSSFSLGSEEWITRMDLQLWKDESDVVVSMARQISALDSNSNEALVPYKCWPGILPVPFWFVRSTTTERSSRLRSLRIQPSWM